MGPCPGVRARPSARAKTTDRRGVRPLRTANLGQPQAAAHGRPTSAPTNPPRGAWLGLGRRCVTPRQTCPRPKGFGRNLRSKTRWFTGFCNSLRSSSMREPRYPLPRVIFVCSTRSAPPPSPVLETGTAIFWLGFLGATRAGVWFVVSGRGGAEAPRNPLAFA